MSSAFDVIPAGGLRRPNTYELIVSSIVELIRSGRLSPGDPIPTERQLMERFGAGRSSVREAMRVLESKSLIHGDRAGFFVSDPHAALSTSFELVMRLTGSKLRDLMELRRIMEGENARVAARVRTNDDIAALREANASWEAALRAAVDDDSLVERAAEADLNLHIRIAQATGNSMVVAVMQALREVTVDSYRSSIAKPATRNAVAGQHEKIIDAIEAQDEAGASDAMNEHLLHVVARLGAELDRPLYG